MATTARTARNQLSVQSLVQSFSTNVRRFPDAPALIWRGAPVSYRELNDRALCARTQLNRADIGSAPIGLRCSKSPDSIALVLACLMDQRSFLLPSTTLPEHTLRELFLRAGCVGVLTAPDPSSGPSSGKYSWMALDRTRHDRGFAERDRQFSPDPDVVTFMLTTSGSTGLPKIVPLSEGAVDRFTDWAGTRFELGPGRSVLNFSPLNFDLCLLDIWATLKHGGCVVLVEPARATSGEYLRDLLIRHEVELVQAVPMCYQLLAQVPTEFAAVRHAVITGDSIAPQGLAQLPGMFPHARLYNLYGCTETNDSLLYEIDPADLPAAALPLGDPLPGVRVLLVDKDGTIQDGPGKGELYVSTPFQTSGYLGLSDNESRFVAHPSGAGGLRYFRTGDLVCRHEDGSFTLAGRKDFVVKVRGVRTNIEEVEQVIRRHPDISEVAVVAVPDPVAGNLLHAETRRVPGSALNSLLLRRFCADHLPLTAIPSTVRISDDPLPRTSTGKVDRRTVAHHLPRKAG